MRTPFWLSGAFRPFFFFGSLLIAATILAWVPLYTGMATLLTAFSLRDWHIHMLLFGGVGAIIAGFLLTAIANWTGRPPVGGLRLGALLATWMTGRLATTVSAQLDPWLVAAVDVAFFLFLIVLAATEIIAAKNYRNLKIILFISLLALADLGFHYEEAVYGAADYSWRAALSIIILLNLVIAGRIIPNFTKNWLVARGETDLPVPFNRADGVILLISLVGLAAWVLAPQQLLSASMLAAASLANFIRGSRWQGHKTTAEPLLFVLHGAWLLLSCGFLCAALAALGLVEPATASHLWTAGGIGLMTLAIMTRASKGHSGLPLRASGTDLAIYGLVVAGALARIAAPAFEGNRVHLLAAAGLCWATAYLLFAVSYGRTLLLGKAV